MADHQEMTKTTPREFLLATLGGLFAPGLAIFMIVMLFLGIQGRMGADDPADVSEQAVEARITGFVQFAAVDPNAPKVELGGQQVYQQVCASCHATGALGSPRHQSVADWAPRIGKGYDLLLSHAINGFHQMPARGGEPNLTDLEVARATVYMTNAAGARFEAVLKRDKVPTAAELARGQVVYAENCAHCHATGITGAQQLDDVAAWSGLLKQGRDYLYEAAIQGTFGGPPRGGNDKLSDADTMLAVDYMIDRARAAIAAQAAAPVK